MTDAELRDAAVAELKLTTAGWRKPNGQPNYPSGTAPATTHWGKAMSLLGQIGQAPPPAENPYWKWDAESGQYVPLSTIFETTTVDARIKSWGGLEASLYDQYGMTTDPNQRVSIRQSIAGRAASRQELRTTDGPWTPSFNYDKATVRNLSSDALGVPFAQGLTRWFSWDFYLPLISGGDTFNWSAGGWHTLMDLHGNGSQYEQNWNVLEAIVKPTGSNPYWLAYHLGAHEGPSDPAPDDTEYVNLVQLSDAAGGRVSASYNIWHRLVVGVKFAPDASGWVALWLNGVNVLPQHARPTCFPNETGIWMQAQNYKQHGAALFGGAQSSVIYYGGLRAGLTKAAVS